MIKLTNLGLLMILPLFTVALVASYNSPAYGGGHGVGMPTQGAVLCLPSEVAIIRTTNPQMICVDKTTAAKWEQYGMATIVGGKAMEESMEEPKSTLQQRLDEIIAKIERGERLSKSEVRAAKKAIGETESEEVMKKVYQESPSMSEGAQGSLVQHSFGRTGSGTATSSQDAGAGHESHQLAVLLPPSENIYVGKITFSASEPVQYVSLIGPLEEMDIGGQPIWSPDDETTFALTFVDNGLRSGGWYFAGNALALHTMTDTPFTVTYSLAYAEVPAGVYPKGTVATGTITSMPDPGQGHESHSLAIILPPRDIPYQGGVLAYSASEIIQLVALHGPIAKEDVHGQSTWSPDGETIYALTLIEPGNNMGVWNTFSGNALALHTMNPDGFTASYTIAGLH